MSSTTYADLLSRNITLIEVLLRKTASEESRFIEDLQLDSIDLVGLISEIEEEFNVFIPEERLHLFRTVGDVTRCLHEILHDGEQVA